MKGHHGGSRIDIGIRVYRRKEWNEARRVGKRGWE